MIALRLVSIDDLIDTLAYIAKVTEKATEHIHSGQARNGAGALWTIRNEALDAIARAECAD